MAKPLFTIIFGPTASGKSRLAYDQARELKANVLSFDSRHVYRGMDIVTGKDLPPANAAWHIFGIDLVYPTEAFSIRQYYDYAKQVIGEHRKQHKGLILVGGSWQYVSVLLEPPASLLVPPNPQLRQELQQASVTELQQRLQKTDVMRLQQLNESDKQNPRRLLRAIEVAEGEKVRVPPLIGKDEVEVIILNPPLAEIEKNIRKRIDQRLEEGALEETQRLIKHYENWKLPAFTSTGYGILRQHLEGEMSLEEAKQLWYLQERQYAKRQLTWLKKIQG